MLRVNRDLICRCPSRTSAHRPASQGRQSEGGGEATSTKKGSVKAGRKVQTKVFVLDTNMMMHDPVLLFRFAEHDVFIPMMTLEELDNNKKGMSDANRNARAVSSELDALVSGAPEAFKFGYGLHGTQGSQEATVFPDLRTECRIADGAANRQGRQPDSGCREGARRARTRQGGHPRVKGHQHADQGACVGAAVRELLQ